VFALVLAPFALAPAGAGCDGETSFVIPPADAGAPGARYAGACAAWARGFCALQAACPAYYVLWNEGQCVPRLTLECEIVASDPHVPFDPGLVASCPEPDAGSCAVPGGDLCLPPGRAPLGAPCLAGAACETGRCEYAYDTSGQPSLCGTCAPLPCGGSCPGGQLCSLASDGGASCVRVAAEGESCSVAADCATFYCASTGTCGPQALPAERCGDGATGPPCAGPDTFCDASGRCRRYLPAGYGERCAPSGGDAYRCTGFGTCDYASDACIPPAADGQFCDDTQGLNCLVPARCIAHRCLFPSLARCSGS
jgi:hypothetical protein